MIASNQQRTGPSPSGNPEAQLCTWAKKGNCSKGDNCTFWHPHLCPHYNQKPNGCVLGKSCNFRHVDKDDSEESKRRDQSVERNGKGKDKGKKGKKGKGKGTAAWTAQPLNP